MQLKIRHLLISIMICSVMVLVPAVSEPGISPPDGVPGGIVYAADEEAEDVIPQSSFEYKHYYSHKTYRNVLRIKMPDVFRTISPIMSDEETVPIPGTVITCTGADGNIISDTYIPQGICSTGSHWLVTAYDSGKKDPSVIYVIDSQEKQLVSTIALPNTYHVGGIAFDGKRIWLTGDTSDQYKGSPFVQYIMYDKLLALTGERTAELTGDDMSPEIYIKNRPSFLDCEGGKLWVGTYIGTKGTKEGYIYGYTIKDGEEQILDTTLFSVITAIDSSSQGIDFEGNYLYVSSSYKGDSPGIKSSFITKYEISPVMNGLPYLYVGDRELARMEVPKMNEEIFIEDNMIHINFESSANKWKKPVIRTDRILAVIKP